MVEFVRRAQAIAREAGAIAGARPINTAAIGRFLRSINIWFWAIVGLPTLIAGVYFFAIASDLYLSEVKFVVRSPSKGPSSAIAAMLGSAGASGASEDTFAVHEYLMSRDAVRRLEQEDNLRTLLSRPEGDFLTRFPGIWFWRNDFEALYRSYGHFVAVEIDGSSGVSTLQVKAYRPEDAQLIAAALLKFSEQLINALNERARQDSLSAFQREVETTERKIANVQSELTTYRIKQKMLDPKTAATAPLELLAQMQGQEANAKAQLAEVLKNSPNSPQIPLIRTRLASLEKLIADERAKITGDSNSVATTVADYERLDLQKLLGEKTLASAFTSLEAARLEAQRQQLFLEAITQPNLADYPLYPKRLASFATIVASCLLAYGIAWLLIASVREHAAA
jgi:capsular polysaccharide transport system permease protein